MNLPQIVVTTTIQYVECYFQFLVVLQDHDCFFNRGDTEGTNFLKILCLMFVYVLFYVNLCQD